jgi:hypothetical protein
MKIVTAIHFRNVFKISEPHDPAKFEPERMASKLAFWGHLVNTRPDDWTVEQLYMVDRDHYLGAALPYDMLAFLRLKSEPNVPNAFEIHGSPWLTKITS